MTALSNASAEKLRSLIEHIERLEEEKKAIADDITEVFAEAKAFGFDTKVMKRLLKLRKMSDADRQEEDAILATYMHALGMAGTPMGDWLAEIEAKEKAEAADRLAEMAAEDGARTEPTISINGGPEYPMSVVKQAVDVVRARKGRQAGAELPAAG